MGDDLYDVIIIGGGPAGSAAAGYAARAKLRTLLIDQGMMSGALALASKVANYPGIEEEISGVELLRRMRRQAERFGAQFVQAKVTGAELEGEVKKVYADRAYEARAVIIATGASERKRKLPGEAEFLGKGVSYCATCDGAFFTGDEVAVVGHTDHALEETTFMTKHASRVHLIPHAREFRAPQDLVGHVTGNPAVTLHAGARLLEVAGDQFVTGIRIQANGREARLAVKGVFIFLQGNQPTTEFVRGTIRVHEDGCVIVDHNKETSVPGVFAIGDVCCNQLKQAVVAAGEGAIAAMTADRFINRLTKPVPGRFY